MWVAPHLRRTNSVRFEEDCLQARQVASPSTLPAPLTPQTRFNTYMLSYERRSELSSLTPGFTTGSSPAYFAADHPRALPALRRTLCVIDQTVGTHIDQARIHSADYRSYGSTYPSSRTQE